MSYRTGRGTDSYSKLQSNIAKHSWEGLMMTKILAAILIILAVLGAAVYPALASPAS